MSNKPFDRQTIGVRERPLSTDVNVGFSEVHQTMRDVLMALLSTRNSASSPARVAKSGFLVDGFQPQASATPAMSVVVNSGFGFVFDAADIPSSIGSPDLDGVSDLSEYKPIYLGNQTTFAVPAAPGSPNSRIDLIEVRTDRVLRDATTKLQLNLSTRTFGPKDFFKTLSYALDGDTGIVTSPTASTAPLGYKIGVAANPGVAPTVTPGYMAIGYVLVPNGTTTITASQLIDARPLLINGGVHRASARLRLLWNTGAPSVTLLSCSAPPGVSISGHPEGTSTRGCMYVYCLGAQIVDGSFQCTLETSPSLSATIYQVLRTRTNAAGTDPLIGPLSSAEQTELLASVPSIRAGIGSARMKAIVEVLRVDGSSGLANQSDASLEDLVFNVAFDLRY